MMIAGPKKPPPKFGQPVLPNLNVRHLCPNCREDPPNIVEEYSSGDLTFAGDENSDDPSRVGDAGNMLLKNNFETAISGLDGRTGMSANLQRAQARANAQSHIAGKTSNAVLQAVFTKITDKCEALQLPRNVVMRAQHVYKIADDQRAVKGKKEETIIAACIIYASRDAGANRTMGEIGTALKVAKKDLGQVFTAIKAAVQREKQAGGSFEAVGGASVSRDSIESLLARYCNLLDLDNTVQNAARHVVNLAMAKTNIDGRSPVSIAAGVLYFAITLFERKVSPKDISEIAGVSESTIKLVCRIVASRLDDVIRPEWGTSHAHGYSILSNLGKGGANGKSRGGTPKGSAAGTPQPDNTPPKAANGNGSVNGNGHSNGNGNGNVPNGAKATNGDSK